MQKPKDLQTIIHIEDKDLGVGAYEDRYNFTPLYNDPETSSCSVDHYVIINKGLENEERIDFGKAFRAIDYANAYIEQKQEPKYTFLNFVLNDYIPGISSGYVKLTIFLAYSENTYTDTLRFDFTTIEMRDFFIQKVDEAFKAQLKPNETFGYTTIMGIFENVKIAFAEEPNEELENL